MLFMIILTRHLRLNFATLAPLHKSTQSSSMLEQPLTAWPIFTLLRACAEDPGYTDPDTDRLKPARRQARASFTWIVKSYVLPYPRY